MGKLGRKAITSCVEKLSVCWILGENTPVQGVTHWAYKSNFYLLQVIVEYNCSWVDRTLLYLHFVLVAFFSHFNLLRSWSTLL
jgi:hypothetical protein